jgi:hypothetical protein
VGEAGGGVEFSHGEVEGGNEEERVVAKAEGTARGGEDKALEGAFGGEEDLCVACEGQSAAVAGVAAGVGDAVERAEEGGIIALVYISISGRRLCGCGRGGEGLVFCVAGGADAGGIVEGEDF